MDSPSSTAKRPGSRLLPHEWLAIAFAIVGVFLLENLPVTYPRSALFLSYASPVIVIAMLSALVLVFLRRRMPSEKVHEISWWVVRSLLLMGVVMPVSFLLKSFIYLMNSRVWDPQLLELDRLLLFGFSPSIFFTELFQNSAFLRFLDLIYSRLYYFILISHVVLLMILPPRRARLAFMASYSSMWIVGIAIAIAFPSWGPVFLWPDIFENCLMNMPGTVGVQSVLYEEISSLVRDPLGARTVRFGCVSAFPSLHLAVVTIIAIGTRTVSTLWFRFNLLIVVLIFIGSIVSGYHYLIDSVAGIALGISLWFWWNWLYRDYEESTISVDGDDH